MDKVGFNKTSLCSLYFFPSMEFPSMATSVFFWRTKKKFHMCGMELCDREKDLIIARRGSWNNSKEN